MLASWNDSSSKTAQGLLNYLVDNLAIPRVNALIRRLAKAIRTALKRKEGAIVPIKPATIQPILIPVGDAAAMLGISIWTARRMAYSGKVASANVGKKLLIPATEIDRLVAENLRPAIKRGNAK